MSLEKTEKWILKNFKSISNRLALPVIGIINKMRNKTKSFTDWLWMAEKDYGDKFEEKYKKGLNITRIVALMVLICCIPFLRQFFIKVIDPTFWKFSNIGCFIISAIFLFILLYILIVFYKAWIKKLWYFLQKDPIVHYIFLALIPSAIIFIGFHHFFVKSPGASLTDPKAYDEIIDRLNGFYASLFTAIAVIAAIIALGAWKTVKELREKLENFKIVEDEVQFLKEKSALAQWVQNLFDNDEEKKIMNSTSPVLSDDDKKKLERVKKKIVEDTTDDSWLKIIYAKELMKSDQGKKIENFKKIKKIYDYIENRDLLKDDSDIRSTLFHLQGKLYWEWYKLNKKNFKNKNIDKSTKFTWYNWWSKNDFESSKLLIKSESYYQKAIDDLIAKDQPKDETLGNIAVVLIELSKFQWGELKNDCLKKALDHLKTRKKDYNTYYDNARATYYMNPRIILDDDKNDLIKAAKNIESKKDKEFFMETLDDEKKEIGFHDIMGFPGNDEIIRKVEEILDNKCLS